MQGVQQLRAGHPGRRHDHGSLGAPAASSDTVMTDIRHHHHARPVRRTPSGGTAERLNDAGMLASSKHFAACPCKLSSSNNWCGCAMLARHGPGEQRVCSAGRETLEASSLASAARHGAAAEVQKPHAMGGASLRTVATARRRTPLIRKLGKRKKHDGCLTPPLVLMERDEQPRLEPIGRPPLGSSPPCSRLTRTRTYIGPGRSLAHSDPDLEPPPAPPDDSWDRPFMGPHCAKPCWHSS